MFSLRTVIVLLFIVFVVMPQNMVSQERKGLTGVGIQIFTPPFYNNSPAAFLGSMEMQPDILVSAWVANNITIEPSIGVISYKNFTYWRLGFAVVNHFGQERLSPYVLFRAKTYLLSNGGIKIHDYLFGLAGGGEYFIAEKFSVSGEAQLNYLVPDKKFSLFEKRNTIMTGVGITVRFYLN